MKKRQSKKKRRTIPIKTLDKIITHEMNVVSKWDDYSFNEDFRGEYSAPLKMVMYDVWWYQDGNDLNKLFKEDD